MTTQSASSPENVFAKPPLGRLLHKIAVDTVVEWRRRIKSRRELATLTALELKDIGYPARAEAEKAKPFWRA
ncbi:MAG: DUF1127 domain-containing protein [Xanthobacteraceae bacterium]|jgi:uncharacterized protein YjiS (DUF1127 family)